MVYVYKVERKKKQNGIVYAVEQLGKQYQPFICTL